MSKRKVSPESLQAIKKFGLTTADISDQEFADFFPALTERSYQPGELFTNIGDKEDRLAFIVSGLFKIYYIDGDGQRFIRSFCHENQPLGSYATVLNASPSHVSIEALEPSVLVEFSYKHFANLFEKNVKWERLARKIAEEHYKKREEREFVFLTLNSEERVRKFQRDFPHLLERVNKVNIASYLGIAPETLSRILKKIG